MLDAFEFKKSKKKLSAHQKIIAAVVGGAAAVSITKNPLIIASVTPVFIEFLSRAMSRGQERKVGLGINYIYAKIHERIQAGHSFRTDNFFNKTTGRADADEILEGVLLKCQQEHQEKKIRYVSNIFGNSAFETYVPEVIHIVMSIGERMTYRQMVLLALLGMSEEIRFNAALLNVKTDGVDPDSSFLNHESNKLSDEYGLIHSNLSFGNLIVPKFTAIGEAAFKLMSLRDIPIYELRELARKLEDIDAKFKVKHPDK